MRIHCFLILSIGFIFNACKPETLLDCVNSAGPVREVRRNLSAFTLLKIDSDIDLTWRESTDYYAIIKCGRNLHKKIRLEVSEGYKLLIKNENQCNWVRDYDQTMEVELHSPSPDFIAILGYGNINFMDTLKAKEIVFQHYGASKVCLAVKTNKISIDFASANYMDVSGKTEDGWIQTQNFGKFNGSNLSIMNLYLEMRAQNDVTLRVNGVLDGFSQSDKNIYLYGNPNIKLEERAKGKIIPLAN